MQPITDHYQDIEFDAIQDLLYRQRKMLHMRDWVEMQDLYVDKNGDIHYVEVYNQTYSREEGHGFHDILESSEPVEYIPYLTKSEAEKVIKDYIDLNGGREELEDKEPHPLVWVGMFAVLGAMGWLLLLMGQAQ